MCNKPSYDALEKRVRQLEHADIKRKQAEQALRRSEEKYRQLVENANTIILKWKRDGHIQFLNEYGLTFFGYRRDEIIGKHLVGTLVPAIEAGGRDLSKLMLEIFENPRSFKKNQNENIKKDGSRVWITWSNHPVYDDDGRVASMFSVGSDITDLKNTQQALENERTFLSAVLDTIEDAIVICDGQGKLVRFNEAARRLHGLPEQPIAADKWAEHYDLYQADAKTPLAQKDIPLYRALQGEHVQDAEIVVAPKNSEPRVLVCSGQALTDGLGGITAAVVAMHDITERKKAEAALRESEERFHKMLGVLPDMISIHDPDMNILYSNWQGFAAVPPEKRVLNTKCYRTYRGLDDICPDCKAKSVLVSWKPFQQEIKLPEDIWVDLRVIPFMNENEEVEMFMEWVRDITDQKTAAAESEKLREQLNQAQRLESVGRLAGGVAHDFNNMLSVIIGYAELAMDGLAATDAMHHIFQEIHKAAQRSATITRQLLAFARKQTIVPRVLDLNETVAGMLKMLRRLIGEDITLYWLPGEDIWPIRMDASQIDQILANLCVNARDAIADVGTIRIKTGAVSLDKTHCGENPEFVPGDFVVLTVSDDGCGMDEYALNNLFEPFFTTKDVDQGTGLGLSTVYGIVKQNKGFITVLSAPGEGTTFELYLPRYDPPAELHRRIDPELPLTEATETILLVEDEPAILEITSIMLRKSGYTVLSAATPGNAIRQAREHAGEIDLLITDVVMPEMTGRDLAGSLLSLYPKLKCLFMSGYTADIIAHHGVIDQDVHFIQKPFSSIDLSRKVRETLGQGPP